VEERLSQRVRGVLSGQGTTREDRENRHCPQHSPTMAPLLNGDHQIYLRYLRGASFRRSARKAKT
ncbi:MAG: hypothetical protein V3T24_11505, partial [Longimicrobiales bacterium]